MGSKETMRVFKQNPVSYLRFAGMESLSVGTEGTAALEYSGHCPVLEVLWWI